MGALERALYTLGSLDTLASGTSFVHQVDARAKIVVTLAFAFTVMSFHPYTLSALLPLSAFPLVLAAQGGIPWSAISGKVLLAAPLVVFVGICNPWLDTSPVMHIAGVDISGGWLSFASILLRCALTVSAVTVLVGVTGFASLCAALPRLGLPRAFAVQLLFLYRYIFVLIEEAASMQRARQLRALGRRGLSFASCVALLGQFLLRTLDRAQRIHQAMLCRGFDGSLPQCAPLRFGSSDALFMLGWLIFFLLVRLVNLPLLLERTLFSLLTSL